MYYRFQLTNREIEYFVCYSYVEPKAIYFELVPGIKELKDIIKSFWGKLENNPMKKQ